MPGPLRTPTSILKLTGSWRAKARLAEGEPQPILSDATPPDWLEGVALQEWNRLAPEMVSLGVLTIIDRDSLAFYCEAVSDAKYLRKILKEDGLLIPGERGIVKHPAMQLYREACTRILRFAQELGFTPASRARVRSSQPRVDEQEETPAAFAAQKDGPEAANG